MACLDESVLGMKQLTVLKKACLRIQLVLNNQRYG